MLTHTIFAFDSFWQKFIDVEDSFFNKTVILELIESDINQTLV